MRAGSQSTVTVNTTDGPLVGANGRRVHLLIGSPRVNRVTITDQSPAVLDQGLTLLPGTAPVKLCLHDAGEWVQRSLRCITTGAPETITVIEVIE